MYILHRKYQANPYSSACGAAVAPKNHFLSLYRPVIVAKGF